MTAPLVLAALPSLPIEDRHALPDTAAIYVVLAGDTVLYVGQSVNVRQRWLAHHRLKQLNERGACRIAWLTVDDTSLLDELERACIAHFAPVLNGEVTPGGIRGPQVTVGLAPDALSALRQVSLQKGIKPATLVRMWVIERLRQELPGWSPSEQAGGGGDE